MKKVSIVILNWNGEKLLQKFLPTLIQYSDSDDTEIVVADNNSTDQSVKLLSTTFPDVRIIRLAENYGYAKGYNLALEQIDAEYVVLLNSDVEVTENWLKPVIDFLDQNKDVAAVQPKILAYNKKTHFEYAGAAGGFIDKYGYPFCRGRIFAEQEVDLGQYESPIDIFWASGACLIMRLNDFRQVGGLDPSFFAHMEEIDMCWRLNARGRKIVCIPQSIVYHVGGATLSAESPRKTFLNFRNNLLMLYKNLSPDEFQRVFRVRVLLDYVATIQMLLSGRKKNAIEIRKAHKEFARIKKQYSDLRTQNLALTVNHSITTIYNSSIIKQFYAKGLKTFDRLKF